MSDVATLAGVAPITVSRALRSPELVTPETLKRIQLAVEATGFIPNIAAGALKTRSSNLVTVVFPTLQNSIAFETLKGIDTRLKPHGFLTITGETNFCPAEEEKLLAGFLGWRPAGVILAGLTHTQATLKMLESSGTPLVEIWAETDNPRDQVVGIPNRQAIVDMVHAMFEWGYGSIAYVHLPMKNNERAAQRYEGYRQGLKDCGLSFLKGMHIETENTYRAGAEAVHSLKTTFPDLEAVIFGSDILAVGAIMECRRRDWKVPQDLAIAGTDDLEIATEIVPALTTTRTERTKVGQRAAELLLDRISGRTKKPLFEATTTSVIRRESA